jgi:prevent-host-death family protein
VTEIINIQEAKTHLSRLVEEAVAGKEIIVGKSGKPLVRLVPYRPTLAARKGGQFSGRITETANCWEPEPDPFDGALDSPIAEFPRQTSGARSLRVAEDASPS